MFEKDEIYLPSVGKCILQAMWHVGDDNFDKLY